ncbi:MAG: PilZ domain-containing protein [Candidatus Dactylopiibacterium sp.]|nr:PilZ domain-containing protein [Candidatus Dactylopiibacterium sp.]
MNPSDLSPTERRQRQRFAAVRDGKPCIDLVVEGRKLTLIDLSLDGFSVSQQAPCPEGEFDFTLRLIDGFGDRVQGRARAVNRAGGLTGCVIVSLQEGGERVLQEWLTVIVICGASVRLTPADAEAIVKGPSLI